MVLYRGVTALPYGKILQEGGGPMLALAKALIEEPEISQLISRIDGGGCPAVLSGFGGIHRAHAAAALRSTTGRPFVFICSDEMEAKRMVADLRALLQENVFTLTGREFTFYNAESVSRQLEQRRLRTLYAMISEKSPLLVVTVDGLMQRTLPPEKMREVAVTLKMGAAYDMNDIVQKLVLGGYSRCEQVEGPGQFAVRGGILDFFSPAQDEPVRCEFFGDDIDSMNLFDVSTQRRTEMLDEAIILPAAETLASMYGGEEGTGEDGLKNAINAILHRLEKRKTPNHELLKSLSADIDRLENRRVFPAADKYMELIYRMSTAADS
jgi:transcription-repair coupling factor (superfamily II helicase)